MSDYVKATDFASKDTLPSGDPLKKVRGAEIDDEFTAIQTAVGTKLDKTSPVMTGTPTAPTPSIASVGTQIVNAEWVRLLINTIEPIGTIKAYARPVGEIPTGWAVCDGANGTLNLTDRFIAGFSPGNVYGQNGTGGHTPGSFNTPLSGNTIANGVHAHGSVTGDHALTIDQIPSHTHSYTSYSEANSAGTNPATTGNTTPNPSASVVNATGGGLVHNHGILSDGDHFHSLTGATAQVPGFFALMFIQKIANI